MTREEADRIHEVLAKVPGLLVTYPAPNIMDISAAGPNFYIMRSFSIDPAQPVSAPVVSPTVQQTFTQGTVTYVAASGRTYTVSAVGGGGSTRYGFTGPGTFSTNDNSVPVFTPGSQDKVKCCCGADSVGGKHSSYCDKGESK